jgi:hypothetical protein
MSKRMTWVVIYIRSNNQLENAFFHISIGIYLNLNLDILYLMPMVGLRDFFRVKFALISVTFLSIILMIKILALISSLYYIIIQLFFDYN